MSFTPGPGTKFLLYSGGVVPSGTANGVLYLNGSKVVTSGSALTFDGTNFATTGISSSTNANGLRAYYPSNSAYYSQLDNRDGNLYLSAVGAGAMQIFLAGGSEQMRLTGTGLGIGTSSPAYKLDVNGDLNVSIAQSYRLGTAQVISYSGGNLNITDTGGGLNVKATSALGLWAGGSVRATIDSSGNLGLGVTPQAWSVKAFEIVGGSALSAVGGADYTLNAYYNAGWLYRGTGLATRYEQNSGQHRWYTAISGTAGNSLTFTQAMTLTSGGDLAIGATSTSGYRLFVSGNVYLAGTSHFIDANTITFRSAAAVERVKIPSAGGLVIGPAAIATTATDGFLYVPTCAGTPTGTPTTQTGTAPIVIDTTNHKLYFYSGGTWRDAGP
jgi:hypothetical protein